MAAPRFLSDLILRSSHPPLTIDLERGPGPDARFGDARVASLTGRAAARRVGMRCRDSAARPRPSRFRSPAASADGGGRPRAPGLVGLMVVDLVVIGTALPLGPLHNSAFILLLSSLRGVRKGLA